MLHIFVVRVLPLLSEIQSKKWLLMCCLLVHVIIIIVNSRVRGGKSGMGPATSDQCGQNPREG